jgi:hypothetical protein
MANRFHEIAFTPRVKVLQEQDGSRSAYARQEGGDARHDRFGANEAAFVAARDSFYLASTSETGWPYVQHRGGPAGFVRAVDAKTLAFPDFRGNRQFISLGNLFHDNRVAAIFMDYPNRTRLKVLGRARVVAAAEDPGLAEALALANYNARIERLFCIDVEAFDWNCPQHITRRYTVQEVEAAIAPLHARIRELEAALAAQESGRPR